MSIARRSRMPTPGDGTEPRILEPFVVSTSNPGDSLSLTVSQDKKQPKGCGNP